MNSILNVILGPIMREQAARVAQDRQYEEQAFRRAIDSGILPEDIFVNPGRYGFTGFGQQLAKERFVTPEEHAAADADYQQRFPNEQSQGIEIRAPMSENALKVLQAIEADRAQQVPTYGLGFGA